MNINSNSIFYIVCPANFATGGPEALHQIGHELSKLGHKVFMHYFFTTSESPVHESYIRYNLPYTDEIINDPNNFLILPETFLGPVFKEEYANLNKIIWWLSVTNYWITLNEAKSAVKHKNFYTIKSRLNPKKYPPIGTLQALKRKNVLNLAHSYFSLDFLKKNKMKVLGKISDYMSESFYSKIEQHVVKEDIILYNPKKNGEYLDRIRKLCPDLNWKALIDMTPDEVAHWMNKSKLYIDFGYHPGQERMPREAILMGCCVITGKQGSAAYNEDVPLPIGYKFDENTIEPQEVVKQIYHVLNNFDDEIKLFKDYKSTIINEEVNFDIAVERIFK